jgi:hypothetical protein
LLKDIFIDNDCAKNFANPLDPEYKRLIIWLIAYNPLRLGDNAYLVINQRILNEYNRTSGLATSSTNIIVVIEKLKREGRLEKISNHDIRDFKRQHFTKGVSRRFTCNHADQDNIAAVLISDRKMALSRDKNFLASLQSVPGFITHVARRPQDLQYDV